MSDCKIFGRFNLDAGVRLGQFKRCTFIVALISTISLASIGSASLGFVPSTANAESPGLLDSADPHFLNPDVAALRSYAQDIGGTPAKFESIADSMRRATTFHDPELVALHAALGAQAGAGQTAVTKVAASGAFDPHFSEPDFGALRDYAKQIGIEHPDSVRTPAVKLAEAGSAFEALRDLFKRGEQPNTASPPTSPTPGAAPRQPRPVEPRPAAPRPAPPRAYVPPSNAQHVGDRACLFCHATQAASFDKTLMGRVNRTTHKGKLDCESCHGPGSNHIQAAGCAACHGEGGISTTRGIPSLVGQDPQYLIPAMRAYVSGERKHELMKLVLAGVSEAELRDIALYYARQAPDRVRTPPVGDAAAGRSRTGSCADCHGERGISTEPGWPSLAGQDAQSLADAIRGYKNGSRRKVVACAACHGEGGISKRPGMPSLVGMGPQYLVAAMKAYVTGQRKHELMKVLISGSSEAELSNIALFYARQAAPVRAQTPLVGDPSAGKSASSVCAGCHGEQGMSAIPAWPGLAGQDSRYLASAIKDYKRGSRGKVVACAGCHGEGGISKLPGMPSLAGLGAEYLAGTMEDYLGGQRKHELMKALLAGMGAAEIKDIAQYYAAQPTARASTPAVGNPSAGKAASAVCDRCHESTNPEFSSLAGQDARYLADAMKAYKNGLRDDPVMRRIVAPLSERTINDLASYYADLTPPPPSGTPLARARREPAVDVHGLMATLDDRAIDNIASYFASFPPAPPAGMQKGPAGREPVVVRNGLVASLDDRSINNVASYYASLQPVQPASAKGAAGHEPALVSTHRPSDGSGIGGIISYRKDDPSRRVEDNNTVCLSCHERGDRTYWNGSTHETRAVACTDCHAVMRQVSLKANLKVKTELETCFQCHKDRRAQIFRSSHMPMREGKITCSNCHNSHGSATEALLRENSINDNCYKCHAEKRGPFLFEHAPVRENCASCHDPHGTNNEYLLKVSRPRLCAECHGFGHGAVFSGPLAVESVGRSCQNCHTAVHGSNSPAGPLLQR